MSVIGKYIQRSVFTLVFVLFASSAWAQSASMDELYKKALKEGGTLNFYGTLAQISADKVLPVVRKTLPRHQDQSCGCHFRQNGCAGHRRSARAVKR